MQDKLIKATGFLGGYQHVFAVVYADKVIEIVEFFIKMLALSYKIYFLDYNII